MLCLASRAQTLNIYLLIVHKFVPGFSRQYAAEKKKIGRVYRRGNLALVAKESSLSYS